MSSNSVFFLTVLALFLAGAEAATITVGPEGCDHVSIQAAIDAASPGDVVEVQGGTYHENLVVDMSIVLRGAGNGTEKPIVDADGRGSAATIVADGVLLEGFILENAGFGWAGIDVRSKDNLIRGNLVTDNSWYGIFLDGSSGSVIEENVVWKNKYGIWINAGTNDNRILKNVLENNENYNAFDLGTNFWAGNFYGDFDGFAPVYEVPGISSVDQSPSGPEKEPVVEEPHEELANVTEADQTLEEAAGEDVAAPQDQDSASEDVAGGEDLGLIGPDSEDDLAEGRPSANLTTEASTSEEPTERPGLSLMDLGLALDSPSEKEVAKAPAGPRVGDLITDAELGESEANESSEEPVVDEPSEVAVTAVEDYTAEDWVERGDALCRLGRYGEAVACYDQAIEVESELADAWDGKGDALQMTGSYDKAVRCYERALEIDPNFAESWYHKGNTLQMLLRFDEELMCYDEALRIDPQFAEAWNKKGMTLNRLGRYQEALDCFDEALKIEPGYAAAWNNKSWALQMLGESEEAKTALDNARSLGYS